MAAHSLLVKPSSKCQISGSPDDDDDDNEEGGKGHGKIWFIVFIILSANKVTS